MIPKHTIKLMVHAPSRKQEVTVTSTGTQGPHNAKSLDEHSHGLYLITKTLQMPTGMQTQTTVEQPSLEAK